MQAAGFDASAANIATAQRSQTIGDLGMLFNTSSPQNGWEEGGVYKTLLHAANGGLDELTRSGNPQNALGAALGAASAEFIMPHLAKGDASADLQTARLMGGLVASVVGGEFRDGARTAGLTERFNRQLHQGEYDRAKELSQNKTVQNALSKAEGRDITEEELLGRIVREMLRNTDFDTFRADGQISDYQLNAVIGKNNLSGEGDQDPYYRDTQVNAGLIEDNFEAWSMGTRFNQAGRTREQLITDNVENHPVSMTILGAQLQALGLMTGNWSGVGLRELLVTGAIGGGANVAGQYAFNEGDINASEAVLAFGTGAASAGQGLKPLLLMNTGNVFNTSAVTGSDPTTGLAWTPIAVTGGYGVGSLLDEVGSNKMIDKFVDMVKTNRDISYLPGELVRVGSYGGVFTEFTKKDFMTPTVGGLVGGSIVTDSSNRLISGVVQSDD